jgi:hypothetical protein
VCGFSYDMENEALYTVWIFARRVKLGICNMLLGREKEIRCPDLTMRTRMKLSIQYELGMEDEA